MHLRFVTALVLALVGASSVSAQVVVSDWGGRLTNFDPATNNSSVINAAQNFPTAMTIGPDGFLYVGELGATTMNSSVFKYNLTTGALVSTVLSTAQLPAGFQVGGLAFGPGGDLLISNSGGLLSAPLGSGTVMRYHFGDPSPTPVLSGLNQPEGLLYRNGLLYIAEVSNIDPSQAKISKYDFVNPATTFVANGPNLQQPTAMVVGPDGQMYVTDVLGFQIRKFDFNNANNTSIFASGTGLFSPVGLAFGGNHLYVSNFGTGMGPDGFLSQFDAATGAFQQVAVANLVVASAVVAVPEPASMVLFGLPVGVFVLRRLRRPKPE